MMILWLCLTRCAKTWSFQKSSSSPTFFIRASVCEKMLDVLHLGHDLAIGSRYESSDPMDFIRNDVGG
jgi:hypothetical protein